jgi:hypothetical protein
MLSFYEGVLCAMCSPTFVQEVIKSHVSRCGLVHGAVRTHFVWDDTIV